MISFFLSPPNGMAFSLTDHSATYHTLEICKQDLTLNRRSARGKRCFHSRQNVCYVLSLMVGCGHHIEQF